MVPSGAPATEQFLPEGLLLATIVFLSVAVSPLVDNMPPPRPPVALLPERVELLTVSVPLELYMPPPELALLPQRVELLTVSVPLELNMPPPPELALLPQRVELLTVSVLPIVSLYIPPPWLALLPERVELLTVSVP